MAFIFRCPADGKTFRVGQIPEDGCFICPHCNIPCVWVGEASALTPSAPEEQRASATAAPERSAVPSIAIAEPEGGLPRVYRLVIVGACLIAFAASAILVALWFVSRRAGL
jgi:hypothetical protein